MAAVALLETRRLHQLLCTGTASHPWIYPTHHPQEPADRWPAISRHESHADDPITECQCFTDINTTFTLGLTVPRQRSKISYPTDSVAPPGCCTSMGYINKVFVPPSSKALTNTLTHLIVGPCRRRLPTRQRMKVSLLSNYSTSHWC